MIVGARGSLRARWFGAAGEVDRTVSRHDFGLESAELLWCIDQLSRLPDPIQSSTIDDAPIRHVRLRHGALSLERHRSVWSVNTTPTWSEALFDDVWGRLFARVRTPILKLGIPEADLSHAY